MTAFEAVSSSSTARGKLITGATATVGTRLGTHFIYGANHQRAEQKGNVFLGVCAPESKIDHCWLEVVPHVPAKKLGTSHTHILCIIHMRDVSHSATENEWERGCAEHVLVDRWCARVKLWVEHLCMLSVMYCIALEAFAWPSPAVCDQINVCLTPPSTLFLSHSLTPVLLQFPSSSLCLYSSVCVDDSFFNLLSKWRAERKNERARPLRRRHF